MKKVIYAVTAAIILAVFAAPAAADIITPNRIIPEPGTALKTPPSGIVNDYYISLMDSKCSCSTKIISAKSSVEALKTAQNICPRCLISDVTSNFKTSSPLARQTERYCPLR